MRIYLSTADHINYKTYQVTHPAMYTGIDGLIDEEGNLVDLPVVMPDPLAPVYARLPIKDLVTMYHCKIQTKLVDENDFIDIIQVIDRYLADVERAAQLQPEVAAYVKRLVAFRGEIAKRVERLFRENKELARAFKRDVNPLLAMLERQIGDRPQAFDVRIPAPHLSHTSPSPGLSLEEQLAQVDPSRGVRYV